MYVSGKVYIASHDISSGDLSPKADNLACPGWDKRSLVPVEMKALVPETVRKRYRRALMRRGSRLHRPKEKSPHTSCLCLTVPDGRRPSQSSSVVLPVNLCWSPVGWRSGECFMSIGGSCHMGAKPNRDTWGPGGVCQTPLSLCAKVCLQSVPLGSRSTTIAIANTLNDGESDGVQLQWTDHALMNQPSALESFVRRVQKLQNGCSVAKKLVK